MTADQMAETLAGEKDLSLAVRMVHQRANEMAHWTAVPMALHSATELVD